MLDQLNWQSWFTALIIVVMIAALLRGRSRPHHLFLLALLMLVIAGIVTPVQAASGFTNSAVITVAALFVVAAGVQHTGLLNFLERYLMPVKGGIGATLLRIMSSTSVMSTFLNNTPIVAMLTPQLQQWSKRIGIPVSKLLIPLSYAAIVGGTITLIGTSTNLIVSEMLSDRGYAPFHLFQLAWIGIPATLLVVAWFVLVGHRLLPDRSGSEPGGVYVPGPASAQSHVAGESGFEPALFDRRSYQGSFAFAAPLGGNNWPSGVYKPRHEAAEGVPTDAAKWPSGVYRTGSIRLAEEFDLRTERHFGNEAMSQLRSGLHFASLSDRQTGSDSNGGDTGSDIGSADSSAGTTTGGNNKRNKWGSGDVRDRFTNISVLVILISMIGVSVSGLLPVHWSVILAAAAMVVTGSLPVRKIRAAIHLPVLLVIGAALGIGSALEQTGLAELLAYTVIDKTSGYGVVAVLVGIYVLTNLLTEMVTNNAAAVLMVPVALSTAVALGIDPQAIGVTVAIAASASFLSPIGYQTNLMVMEPGNYRFTDYMKAGFPVTLILMAVTVGMVTWIWI